VTNPIKEALTALADALAKRPAEEILLDWFRSGRLVGELSVLIKRRHPEVQAEIDRIYQEHLAKLGKRCSDSGNGGPLEGLPICPVADDDIDRGSGVAAAPHCGEISRAARLPPQCPSNVSTGKRGLSWTITGANWPGLAS
jgi:hypothetical protein